MNLERPARKGRNERRPEITLGDDPRARLLFACEHVGEQVAPGLVSVTASALEHPPRSGSHEGIGVDLAMRMMESDADLLAPVLEAEHLLDTGQGEEIGVTLHHP